MSNWQGPFGVPETAVGTTYCLRDVLVKGATTVAPNLNNGRLKKDLRDCRRGDGLTAR